MTQHSGTYDNVYTAKPVRVRAFQWTGPLMLYPLWMDSLIRKGYAHIRARNALPALRIAQTNRTPIVAHPGDWIVNRDDVIIVHRDATFRKLYYTNADVTPTPQYDMAMG